MHARLPACMHTYMHTYIHSYIPTYIHTYILLHSYYQTRCDWPRIPYRCPPQEGTSCQKQCGSLQLIFPKHPDCSREKIAAGQRHCSHALLQPKWPQAWSHLLWPTGLLHHKPFQYSKQSCLDLNVLGAIELAELKGTATNATNACNCKCCSQTLCDEEVFPNHPHLAL